MKLFINNDIIRINIPFNYSVTLKYSFKNDPSIISKTVELTHGTYDINKFTDKPDDKCYEIGKKNFCKTYKHYLLFVSI
jgi:hypothetical protein